MQVSVYTWTINQQLNITNVTRFTTDVRTEITRVLNYIIVSEHFFSIHYCVNIHIMISMLILRMNACVFCVRNISYVYIFFETCFTSERIVFVYVQVFVTNLICNQKKQFHDNINFIKQRS